MSGQRESVKLRLLTMYSDDAYRPMNRKSYHDLRRDFCKVIAEDVIQKLEFRERFNTDLVPEMFSKGLSSGKERLSLEEAFDFLEMYCLNIIHYYWKPEINTVKRYTGVYRTKLLDVLPEVDQFMTMIGYEKEQDADVFRMKTFSSRDQIRLLALDCLIAQEQCRFFHEVARLAYHRNNRLGWKDVVGCFAQCLGDENTCAELVCTLGGAETEIPIPIPTTVQSVAPPSLVEITNTNVKDMEEYDLYGPAP